MLVVVMRRFCAVALDRFRLEPRQMSCLSSCPAEWGNGTCTGSNNSSCFLPVQPAVRPFTILFSRPFPSPSDYGRCHVLWIAEVLVSCFDSLSSRSRTGLALPQVFLSPLLDRARYINARHTLWRSALPRTFFLLPSHRRRCRRVPGSLRAIGVRLLVRYQ
ncbi:hypothetical protein P280DRAFT_91243 [Massarina eburnea CBS 473.64]|uniref:Uncharacterized protein n=1 Tax=Massarina eburnea CBS 473.64 TaxID=1395130 RepID=A0A6A6RR59_9PLEO|nr:hypothetical protein P280DRAFT_91243 [Massarina eburnea CBS 473.64]